LFYRYSEIRRRAVLETTKANLIVLLHFNRKMGNPANPTLIDQQSTAICSSMTYLPPEWNSTMNF